MNFKNLNIEAVKNIKVNNKVVSKECQEYIFKSLKREGFVLPSFPETVDEKEIMIYTGDKTLHFRINQVNDLGTLITLKRDNQDVTTYRNNQLYWILKDCVDER